MIIAYSGNSMSYDADKLSVVKNILLKYTNPVYFVIHEPVFK